MSDQPAKRLLSTQWWVQLFVVAAASCGLLQSRWPAAAGEERLIQLEQARVLTTVEREDEFPAIGCDGEGRLWVAWISWDGKRDQPVVSGRTASGWSAPKVLSSSARDCWRPAMGRDGSGRLWVTWSENRDGNWDIWGCWCQQSKWSDPVRLTTGAGNDFFQQLACDNTGRFWMAWQAAVDGNYEILLGQLTPQGLQRVQNVSRHPASDWEPAIAADDAGRLYVAWDSYRFGSYDILVCSVKDGQLGKPRLVAGSPAYEAHAAIAVDGQRRLWVAWDNGGVAWGQHGRQRLRLHSRRSVHLVCLDGDRQLAPAEPLAQVLSGPLARFCELPELRTDGQGRLWLLVRHLTDLTPPGKRPNGRPHQARGIWNPVALCYTARGWSQPLTLPDSNGRNDMRVATCLDQQGGLWVAWAEDGRRPQRAEEPVNHNVHAALLRPPALPAAPLATAPLRPRRKPARLAATPPSPPRYQITAGGVTYRLLFGDTHRHTDISRCAMNYDGSLIDTYRYAIDAAQLDFLAISDHDQDLLKHRYSRSQQGPLQDYAWWRSQKYCDLFYIADRFVPIYGYEHGGSYARRGGHKNVLYARRGMPCYEVDEPEQLFAVLRDKEAVVIPHQLADGPSATDWSKWNGQFERVAEIFQARGSYEFYGAPLLARVQRRGHYLWDALGGGIQIGTIASSDHGLVHSAYAGVYARQLSRHSVLEALKSRRTYGATETIVVDFRLGDHLLGQRVELDGPPTFQIKVRGLAPLKQIQVVRDGRFVFTSNPGRPSCALEFTDRELAPGSSAYYYVRCQQADNQWAWSSAIWVRRRP